MVKTSARVGERKLIVVFDRKADSEVKARRNLKRTPLMQSRWKVSYNFPMVRRNKKIQHVMRMGKAKTTQHNAMKLLTSKSGLLSEIDCVYGKQAVEVIREPDKFVYERASKFKEVYVWNVRKKDGSKATVMSSDFTKNELAIMQPDVEGDIGVLKQSVHQLLDHKENDVIAINTHPGHHAGPMKMAGYCVINNIAVAIGLLKKNRPHLKLGVIDIDVHPGDGTHQFHLRQQGLVQKYVSIHSPVKFCNMNANLGPNGICLKMDGDGEVASRRLIDKIQQTLSSWNRAHLDIIIVALGFDTLKHDPEAKCLGFQMLPAHFHEVGGIFAGRQEQIFFLQEGGYNLNETAAAFQQLVKGFREGRRKWRD